MRDIEIESLLAEHGLITIAEYPELRHRLQRRVGAGLVRRPLSGVYVRAGDTDAGRLDAAALLAVDPDAVLAGRTAAALTFAPDLDEAVVTAYRSRAVRPQRGFRLWDGPVPPELIETRNGLRLTSPALTVIDLIGELGEDIIDQGLRARVSLSSMTEALALTPRRAGNRRRAELLGDSKDEPWSAAERIGHRLLRDAGITGWRSNQPTGLVDGRMTIGDVVWRERWLIVEFDGFEHHGTREAFESDRRRDAVRGEAGWRVLRFTWNQLTDEPDEVVRLIREALDR